MDILVNFLPLHRWVARLLLQFQQARLLSAKLRARRTDTCLEL
jgi:hypothetical protein